MTCVLVVGTQGGSQSPAPLGDSGYTPRRVQGFARHSGATRDAALGAVMLSVVTALGRALNISESDLPLTVRTAAAFLERSMYTDNHEKCV